MTLLVLLIIAAIIFYPKIFRRNAIEKLRLSGERISIAVMPFQNMTNDSSLNVWQEGIQFNIIASLSNYSDELKVSPTESINNLIQNQGLKDFTSITPSVARTISGKLDASLFIYGNINKVGKTIRVNAQIIETNSEEAIKSFQMEGTSDNILHTLDSLSWMLSNFLLISNLGRNLPVELQPNSLTDSPDAFKYYIYGISAFMKTDYVTARNLFAMSFAADSNFVFNYMQLAFAYGNAGIFDQAKRWCIKFYEKKDQMSPQMRIIANFAYARFFETPYEEIRYLRQWLDFDDQSPVLIWNIGNAYTRLGQHDKAITEYEKALKIFNEWGSKPVWAFCYTFLGMEYHETGQYKKEKRLYRKALNDFPDDPYLFFRKTVLALTEGDTAKANSYLEKYITLFKETQNLEPAIASNLVEIHSSTRISEAVIASNLAEIYYASGIPDKAEEYYRKALSLQPESQLYLNNLAYFLIDNNRNVNEGLKLIEKELELNPENYVFLDTKGWGLYKQSKYTESLETLQKSWDLRRQYADYYHPAFVHLEEAKKAVADRI
jgi:tetratricopeptide (TPR) repeat protein